MRRELSLTVSKNTNIIEINGNQYNASNGELLNGSVSSAHSPKSVDGFTAPKKPGLNAADYHKSAPKVAQAHAATVTRKAGPTMDIARAPAKAVTHHAQQSAVTLMRSSVAAPKPGFKRQARVQAPMSDAELSAPSKITPKLSAQAISPERLKQARQALRSDAVSRFSKAAVGSNTKSVVSVPKQMQGLTPTSSFISDHPQIPVKQPSLDIFEKALADAPNKLPGLLKSEKAPNLPKRIAVGLSTAVLVVVIGGFLAYQNLPSVHLYVASSKAGFSASFPSYRPAGFSLGKLTASAGVVAINYTSNNDQRSFRVTEKTSSWDSDTLLDSFVVGASGGQYQTIQASGRTIYLYGNSNATWVNGDIWYQVVSSGSLSTQQVIDIATSL